MGCQANCRDKRLAGDGVDPNAALDTGMLRFDCVFGVFYNVGWLSLTAAAVSAGLEGVLTSIIAIFVPSLQAAEVGVALANAYSFLGMVRPRCPGPFSMALDMRGFC